MKILYVTSEALPFVSSGGLADVAGSLPKAIKELSGYDIRVVLPYYECIKLRYGDSLEFITSYTVTLAWRRLYCGVFACVHDGIKYYFIDNEYYFKRPSVYGDYDDCERFAFFSKSVLDLMNALNFFPDVLHANDWQASLTIPYLKKIYISDVRYRDIYSVFTIHNIMYQGRFGEDVFSNITGLPEFCKNDLTLDSDINFMKGAIETADKITTVSPSYKEELLRGENSYRMEYPLGRQRENFTGIINGIDYSYYSLKSDKIYYKFVGDCLRFKKENKLYFQKESGLEANESVPLLSIISRLCEQKGMSIIKPALEETLKGNVQLAILGKGEYMDEEFFKYLERLHPDKVRVRIDFDKDLSLKLYAASDVFLMPSRTEPCGIAQMIATRYGAVPIVRECGGLRDTIKCYSPENADKACGFTFWEYSAKAFKDTITRALDLYYQNKSEWNRLVQNAMKRDFSWTESAKKYIEVYKRI